MPVKSLLINEEVAFMDVPMVGCQSTKVLNF